jgi:hypothetical protein
MNRLILALLLCLVAGACLRIPGTVRSEFVPQPGAANHYRTGGVASEQARPAPAPPTQNPAKEQP